MKPEHTKEIEIIVNHFFLETQRLVNKIVEKIYEIEGIDNNEITSKA